MAFLENDTRQLITALTGFADKEDNFGICVDYALGHFTGRVYPDVNVFEVKRRIQGLCERLDVDLEYKNARELRSLSSKYLDIINSDNFSQKYCGYSVLSLLCNLYGTSRLHKPPFTIVNKLTIADRSDSGFDWVKCLKEDDLCISDLSEEDDNSWSSSDESSQAITLVLPTSPPPQSVDSGIGNTPDSCIVPFPPLGPFRPYEPPPKPQEAISIQRPYWNPVFQKTRLDSENQDRSRNFTEVWEKHLAENYPIYTPETNVILTELNIMREILWMLHGLKKTFVFPFVNGKYHVRTQIHMTHITEETLNQLLSSYCQYGNKMVCLTDFIENVYSNNWHSNCQTIKGYADGLHSLLQQYSKTLTTCEKILIDQKETMTFMKLMLMLKPHLNNLQFLYRTHVNVTCKIAPNTSPLVCAITVIDSLWTHFSNGVLWINNAVNVQVILKLFLTTLYPYINILETACIRGQLNDPFSEFIIERIVDFKVNDEDFWRHGLQFRSLPEFAKDFILQPVFADILLAVKSISMLCSFNCYYDRLFDIEAQHGRLFQTFIDEFHKRYSDLSSPLNVVESDGKKNDPQLVPDVSLSLVVTKNEASVYDTYFEQHPHLRNYIGQAIDLKTCEESYQKLLDIIEPSNLLLLNLVLKESLLECVKSVCHLPKVALVQLLKEKHRLMSHISLMNEYFLMESGDIMFTFYKQIYRKVFEGKNWKNSTFLNYVFRNAVVTPSFKDSEKLSLFIAEDVGTDSKQPLDELASLNLTYNIGWPINLILNDDVQNAYCKIFQFLIQVKCAKFSLDDLYCIPLNGKKRHIPHVAKWWARNTEISEGQIIHGMYILRMKLLHFINGYHNYLMTQILHCSDIELRMNLEKAESFEDILSAQYNHAFSLMESCLPNTNHSYLWDHIKILLNLALKFQKLWKAGIENVKLDELKCIEHEYISSINMVMSYLKQPRKRKENVHLDVLANAVFTKFQHENIFTVEKEPKQFLP